MSNEEREKQIAELEKNESKIKNELVEIIKREKTIQDQRVKESIERVKEDETQLIKCVFEFLDLNKKVKPFLQLNSKNHVIVLKDKMQEQDKKNLREYLDILTKLSKMIEEFPLYDDEHYKSEDALNRAQLVLTLKSLEGFEEWDYYFKAYLEQTGLYFCFVYRCKRCGHAWLPRHFNPMGDNDNILHKKPPKSCARCKSKYWNSSPKRKTKYVIKTNDILQHKMRTAPRVTMMIKNVSRFLVPFIENIEPRLKKIVEEEKTEKNKQEQIITLTNRKKKKQSIS